MASESPWATPAVETHYDLSGNPNFGLNYFVQIHPSLEPNFGNSPNLVMCSLKQDNESMRCCDDSHQKSILLGGGGGTSNVEGGE
jgi:hypothetical protein